MTMSPESVSKIQDSIYLSTIAPLRIHGHVEKRVENRGCNRKELQGGGHTNVKSASGDRQVQEFSVAVPLSNKYTARILLGERPLSREQ